MEKINFVLENKQLIEEIVFIIMTLVFILFGAATIYFFRYIKKNSYTTEKILKLLEQEEDGKLLLSNGDASLNVRYLEGIYKFVIFINNETENRIIYEQIFEKKANIKIERELMYIPKKYRKELKEKLGG